MAGRSRRRSPLSPRHIVEFGVVSLAAAAMLAPWPAAWVEQRFSRGLYPRLQAPLTSWSNQTSVALFDFLLAVLIVIATVTLVRGVAGAVRRRSPWPIGGGLWRLATLAAMIYLWFMGAWGLNYARVPLEARVGYDPQRLTPAALRTLADRATMEVNRSHGPGHAAGFPDVAAVPPSLLQAMHAIETRLGARSTITPSRPKRSLLAPFFRAAGVDGMHAPFLLETLLNPDLTPPERPAVLAHEWAHLAGYAPEDDASFVGLLAALGADPGARYSAWLALFHEVVAVLPPAERQRAVARLDPGPRADRDAIAARQRQRIDVVSRASWNTYDRYLKTQGVAEGVDSYSRVVQLLLGTGALDW